MRPATLKLRSSRRRRTLIAGRRLVAAAAVPRPGRRRAARTHGCPTNDRPGTDPVGTDPHGTDHLGTDTLGTELWGLFGTDPLQTDHLGNHTLGQTLWGTTLWGPTIWGLTLWGLTIWGTTLWDWPFGDIRYGEPLSGDRSSGNSVETNLLGSDYRVTYRMIVTGENVWQPTARDKLSGKWPPGADHLRTDSLGTDRLGTERPWIDLPRSDRPDLLGTDPVEIDPAGPDLLCNDPLEIDNLGTDSLETDLLRADRPGTRPSGDPLRTAAWSGDDGGSVRRTELPRRGGGSGDAASRGRASNQTTAGAEREDWTEARERDLDRSVVVATCAGRRSNTRDDDATIDVLSAPVRCCPLVGHEIDVLNAVPAKQCTQTDVTSQNLWSRYTIAILCV